MSKCKSRIDDFLDNLVNILSLKLLQKMILKLSTHLFNMTTLDHKIIKWDNQIISKAAWHWFIYDENIFFRISGLLSLVPI